MMIDIAAAFLLSLASSPVAATGPSPMAVSTPPDCTAGQLSLTFDGENGSFHGMSHTGTLLVLRNVGPGACRIAALPALAFRDGAQAMLATARNVPPGLHPGPVMTPVDVPAGAEATTALRWVSGDVYDGHHCLTFSSLDVRIGAGTLSRPFSGTFCGPPNRPIGYDQEGLRTDPVLPPRVTLPK
jgi:hypothetical protein